MQGTSGPDQKSYSYDDDQIYSIPLNDRFLYHFSTYMQDQKKSKHRVSVGEMRKHLTKDKLDADVITYNNLQRKTSEASLDLLNFTPQIFYDEFMKQHEDRQLTQVQPSTPS